MGKASCDLNGFLDGACPGELLPPARRSRIYRKLLEASIAAGDGPCVLVDAGEGDLAIVAVTAADWPGLANICLSELHHHGWNLDFTEGAAVEDKGVRRGFILAGIRDSDPARLEKFGQDALRMQGLLQRLAEGRADTVSLMSRATERLEIYEEVRTELGRLLGGGPIPEALSGPSGELVLFISSRSDEYLRERRPEDLSGMVLTNYNLVEAVRTGRGRPIFKVRNLRTTREHLTGINIAGYERDVSLQDCLTALSFAWPGSTIRHQRRYTTGDGIISIRIEMTGASGLAANRHEIKKISDTLRQLLVRQELERMKRIHSYGGQEHYARALIPLLLKECETSKMSQAYISLEASTTFSAELKLVLVLTASGMEEHDRRILGLVGAIDGLEGMTVVSFKSPSSYGLKWVDILNVTVQKGVYPEIENAFEAIKKCISDSIGQFRDFDMGMRLNDVKQLKEVRELLKDIPDSVTTDFYYRLEDFLRAGAPVAELALHIRLAFDAMSAAIRDGVTTYGPTITIVHQDDLDVATLFCCVVPESARSFQGFLDAVKEYRVTASVIDWSGMHAVLLRVHDRNQALPDEVAARIMESLRPLCGRPQS